MVGNVIAAGVPTTNLYGAEDAKAAFALDRDSVDLVANLTSGYPHEGDQFGQSMAMAGDVIAVGANRAKICENTEQGAT